MTLYSLYCNNVGHKKSCARDAMISLWEIRGGMTLYPVQGLLKRYPKVRWPSPISSVKTHGEANILLVGFIDVALAVE